MIDAHMHADASQVIGIAIFTAVCESKPNF